VPAAISSIRASPRRRTIPPSSPRRFQAGRGAQAPGGSGRFAEHAGLPTDFDGGHAASKLKKSRSLPKKRPTAKVSDEKARKAAAAFEREQRRRDAERRKEEAARERGRAKRDKMVAKAQAA
jgi:colicin import membrane protein